MVRTKQTARTSSVGKAPRKQLDTRCRHVAGGAPKQLSTTAAPSGVLQRWLKPQRDRPDESSIIPSANQPSINDDIVYVTTVHRTSNIVPVSTVRKSLLRIPNDNQPTSSNIERIPFGGMFLDNRQQPSQNLTLDQEKKDLETKCAKLEPKLLKKDSELNTLNDLLQSKVVTLKNDYESRLTELKLEMYRLKSSEKQKLSFLETKCAKLNDALAGKNSEMKALEKRLESKNLTHDQEKKDLEAQCTELKCRLLKKDSELEALNNRLQSQSSAFGQEKKHLKKQCTKLNAELVKKDAEFETLKQSKALALQDGESRINKLDETYDTLITDRNRQPG